MTEYKLDFSEAEDLNLPDLPSFFGGHEILPLYEYGEFEVGKTYTFADGDRYTRKVLGFLMVDDEMQILIRRPDGVENYSSYSYYKGALVGN